MEELIKKLDKIAKEFGFPFKETHYPKDGFISQIKDNYEENKEVSIAGRLIAKREHGKSSFADIADISGKIQIYLQKNALADAYTLFKELDIGDIVGVKGKLCKTKTGEITVFSSSFKLLSKTLRSLPEKWHGLKDKELKYRRRYLDLIANPSSREVFIKRSKIVDFIRTFFKERDYFEVETPMLHTIAGGASGRPFLTHHNAYDMDVYLRIAPELYLKRLLVGGFDKVFEINRSFRNEGVSTQHSPEFTMLEAYCAYQDYEYMMNLCENLFCGTLKEFFGNLSINYQGKDIDFTPPWPRISFSKLFAEEFSVKEDDSQEEVLKKITQKLDLPLAKLSRSQILNITDELIEKKYPQNRPVFVTDYFKWTSPLAKAKKDNPYIVERFELFMAGFEVANAYSELNDPLEQKKRFQKQLEVEDELPKKIDEDFVLSLEYAMPPAAGLGIGIDRLIMILLNQPSIKDVILFPLLKP